MIDLGKYAVPVLSAYAGGIAVVVGLVWASLRASARARKELQELEEKRRRRRAR